MGKRFIEVIKNRKNWVSILTLVISLLAVIYSFFVDDENVSTKVIGLVLSLIAFEFFTLTVGILDDIQSDIKSLKSQKGKGIWRDNYVSEAFSLLKNAKKEFIVIGGTLSYVDPHKAYINDVSNEVEFRLLALNVEKDGILMQYHNLIERNGGVENLHHLNGYNSDVQIRVFDMLPLAYFIASDLNYPNGTIIAVHLFATGTSRNFPCIKLTRADGEWYEIYRSQIESLWEKGYPWNPEETKVTM